MPFDPCFHGVTYSTKYKASSCNDVHLQLLAFFAGPDCYIYLVGKITFATISSLITKGYSQ